MKKYLSVLLAVLTVVCLMPSAVFAALPEGNDFKYYPLEDGVIVERYTGNAEHVVIPAEIDGKPVTGLQSYLFADTPAVKSIEIPDTVRVIHSRAFWGCSLLTEITIPRSVEEVLSDIFEGCDNLQKVHCENIPSYGNYWSDDWANGCDADVYEHGDLVIETVGDFRFDHVHGMISDYLGTDAELTVPDMIGNSAVESIGAGVFEDNKTLQRVVLPERMISIGDFAFYGCKNLTEVVMPKHLTWLEDYAFSGCGLKEAIIPEGVMTPGGYVFANCKDLQKVTLCEGLRTLNGQAFSGCESLTDIILPQSLRAIYQYVFRGCNSLREIEIPQGVETIGSHAFYGCNSLTEITIPRSVTELGDRVFVDSAVQKVYCEAETRPETWSISWSVGCDADVYFGDTLAQYRYGDYHADIVDGEATLLQYFGSETELVIPSEIGGCPVVGIGEDTFASLGLTSAVLPDTLRRIGMGAFARNEELKFVEIPDGVTLIEYGAFADCYGLTEVILPTVERICEGAFSHLYEPLTIYYKGDAIPDTWDAGWRFDDCATVLFGYRAVKGDLDFDGAVSATDYMMLKRGFLGTFEMSAVQTKGADVDGDGAVTARDYMIAKRVVLGTYTL